jgi:hypothetical protein
LDEPASSSVPKEGETTNRWVRGIIESEGAWDVPGVAVPSLGVQVRADDVELAAQMTDTECALAGCLVAVGGRCTRRTCERNVPLAAWDAKTSSNGFRWTALTWARSAFKWAVFTTTGNDAAHRMGSGSPKKACVQCTRVHRHGGGHINACARQKGPAAERKKTCLGAGGGVGPRGGLVHTDAAVHHRLAILKQVCEDCRSGQRSKAMYV